LETRKNAKCFAPAVFQVMGDAALLKTGEKTETLLTIHGAG
jgi:hypothetical protein